MMKALLVIVLLGIAGYYAYTTYFAGPEGSSNSAYSLKKVDSKPIPKKEFFELWTDVALASCDESISKRALKSEDCRSKVNEQSGTCTIRVGHSAPSEIRDQSNSQELGKAYLECVTPRPVCRGVEIKNEDEAKRYCR
jgi:hypothetical protein